MPNEKVNSLKINKHKFHVKHYTNEEIKEYFKGKLEFSKMYGQDVYVFREGLQSELLPENKMELVESYEGQVIIYVYQKEPVKNGFIRNFFK